MRHSLSSDVEHEEKMRKKQTYVQYFVFMEKLINELDDTVSAARRIDIETFYS